MERGDGGGRGSAAMLGLDMHLAPQQMHSVAFQQQQQQQPSHHHHHHVGGGFQLQQPAPVRHQQQQYSTSSSRAVTVAASHDEDMACNGKGGAAQQVGAAAGCPWTRMKWTDAMVRLLIRVVYSVGDDGEGLPAAAAAAAAGKQAHGKAGSSSTASQQQQQQKKGKWKSVSRAMMDNGFLVSPQQCEDKFNDLNKRYKRVVDLLGRGRACRVVENHALLDAIDDLTPKARDEARKLLSSKHLFFREMCAYHNSGAAHAAVVAHPPTHDAAACLHHPPPAPMAARQGRGAPSPPGTKDSSADGDDDSEDGVSINKDEDEDDYDEDEDGHMYPNQRPHHHGHRGGGHKRVHGTDGGAAGEEFEEEYGGGARSQSAAVQQLRSELASATAADPQAARCWVRRRAVEVEEHQVTLEWRAHHLEQRRLKWERFRASKERDMERRRLRNDRLRLDGQRMLLMLRHRDLELDMAEANSSSGDHRNGQGHLAVHLGSSPSTAGHPN